jgi:hypothetical protein
MVEVFNYNVPRCWEYNNCQEEIRKDCWAYRLNLGWECWLLREKTSGTWNKKVSRTCEKCKYRKLIKDQFQK